MSILESLKEDHDKVREILKKADELLNKYPDVNVEQEKKLMKQLISELEPHAKAEEKVFYQALKKKTVEILSPYEGKEEHVLVLQVLKALQKESLEKNQRSAKIKVLKEMVLHHIQEEESTYFKEARKSFTSDELTTLGENFIKEKKKITDSNTYLT